MTGVLRTDQVVPHADLVKVVQRHKQNLWRKPCPQHTQVAFEQFLARYQRQPRPLILDSYCGTGMSTALLAEKHPDKWVVGIDQSAHRLANMVTSHESRVKTHIFEMFETCRLRWR